MGISFGDLASFTKGVVDADTAATEARLKDRQAELLADRQLYIDMKTKKYESELKSFEEENKKYKAIQAVKSQVGKDASKSEFGAAYLQETNPTLLYQMQKDFKDNPKALQDQLALYANADFKTTNTRDALDNKLKTDIDAITAGYKKALENARGDSKLVNAILGKRDKEIKLVIEQNKDGETGAIAAKEIATEVDTSNEAYQYGKEKEVNRLLTPTPVYNTAWNTAYAKIDFDLNAKNNKSFKYLNKFSSMGGANEISLKFDKTDGKIVGQNANSITNLLAMEKMFTTIRDNKDAVTAYNINKQPTSIAKSFNNDTVFNEMSNVINQGRVTNIDGRISSDGKNKYNLTTFVPLSVVGEQGEINLGDAGILTVDKKQMENISKLMADFIVVKADGINNKNLDSQSKVSAVYSELFEGNAQTINDFKNYLYAKDENIKNFFDGNVVKTEGTTTETTIQDNKPKSIKTNVRLLPDGSGFVRGNEKFTWENIKNSEQESKLTTEEKIEYDKWNANQNNINKEPIKQTTFKDIQASTEANTKKITDAFTDTEGNFKKMKTNTSNIRPYKKG